MHLHTLQEIQKAIALLSPAEVERIAASVRELTTPRVAESAPAYVDPPERRFLSVDDYLALEEKSFVRHEYVNGLMHAMSGPSEHHELIAGNFYFAFREHLRGGPCRSYKREFRLRLQINRQDIFYYPDVMVACTREGVDPYFLRNPRLIVEVLSPSTQSIDRREKLLSYKQVSSLEEYLLVAQDAREITIHRRADEWKPQWVTEPDASVELTSIELSLPVARIYEDVL